MKTIICEYKGLEIPRSMKITLNQITYSNIEVPSQIYLYPKNYIQEINRTNSRISELESHLENERNPETLGEGFSRSSIIKKDITKHFLIIFQCDIELISNLISLQKTIIEKIQPFTYSLNLLFSLKLILKSCYILEEDEIILYIEPISQDQINALSPRLSNAEVELFEINAPQIIQLFAEKWSYVKHSINLLAGDTTSLYEEKLSCFWNCLEHLTREFFEIRPQYEINLDGIKEKYRFILKPHIDQILEENITTSNREILDSFKNNLLTYPNINLPIKLMIKILWKETFHSEISPEKYQVVKKIYYLRNKLYHQTTITTEILEAFRTEHNLQQVRFPDIITLIYSFKHLLENLFFNLIGLTEQIFQFNESESSLDYADRRLNPPPSLTNNETTNGDQDIAQLTIQYLIELKEYYTKHNEFFENLEVINEVEVNLTEQLQGNAMGKIIISRPFNEEREIQILDFAHLTKAKIQFTNRIPINIKSTKIYSDEIIEGYRIILYGYLTNIESSGVGFFNINFFTLKKT